MHLLHSLQLIPSPQESPTHIVHFLVRCQTCNLILYHYTILDHLVVDQPTNLSTAHENSYALLLAGPTSHRGIVG